MSDKKAWWQSKTILSLLPLVVVPTIEAAGDALAAMQGTAINWHAFGIKVGVAFCAALGIWFRKTATSAIGKDE